MLDAKSKGLEGEMPSAGGEPQRVSDTRPPGKLGTKTGLQLTGWQ